MGIVDQLQRRGSKDATASSLMDPCIDSVISQTPPGGHSCAAPGSCRILAYILRDTPPLAHFLLTDVQWSAHLCYEPITGVKQVSVPQVGSRVLPGLAKYCARWFQAKIRLYSHMRTQEDG
ncbi:hypothetical protein Bbelb_104370 [Branchiostoma belcheri]|nr:hypothetical protein Bbelb_104370 [Branchiostoma belcheri]